MPAHVKVMFDRLKQSEYPDEGHGALLVPTGT